MQLRARERVRDIKSVRVRVPIDHRAVTRALMRPIPCLFARELSLVCEDGYRPFEGTQRELPRDECDE